MKNYISDEEKNKQIEQMWEDYERTNRRPQQFKTDNFLNLEINTEDEDDVALDDPSFDCSYEQEKFKNRRKGKKNDKKSKFSKIPDNDTD